MNNLLTLCYAYYNLILEPHTALLSYARSKVFKEIIVSDYIEAKRDMQHSPKAQYCIGSKNCQFYFSGLWIADSGSPMALP